MIMLEMRITIFKQEQTDRNTAKVLYDNGTFKVIERRRRLAGLKSEWMEYQVRQGRKIVARHDFMGAAIKDAQDRGHKEWDAIGKELSEQ